MGSVYKIIELVGSSETSWEDAANKAIQAAGKSLRDLRVAEVIKQDMKIKHGKIESYRVRLNVSFKVDRGDDKDDD